MKKTLLLSAIFCVTIFSLFSAGLPSGISPELANQFTRSMSGGTNIPGSVTTPTPSEAMANRDYKVTAGDVYSLNFLAGNTPVSFTITVDSSYKIRVANLAVLSVVDTMFIDLKKQVEDIVTKNYPMSGVQFNLIAPGTFTITVKGEVNYAAKANAWALTRLSDVVYGFKSKYGSIRYVKLSDYKGNTKTYDLYKATRYGDFSQDPYMRPGDTVTIMPQGRNIVLQGAVKRPGTYEILNNEDLKDIIYDYGDGFAHMANTDKIEIVRTSNSKDVTGEKIVVSLEDIENGFALEPYDVITVKSYQDELPVVFVQGAITGNNSGSPTPETTVTQKINFNIGETYEMFVKNIKYMFGSSADLTRAYVLRGEEVIPLNIYDILYNDVNNNILIEPNDNLTIPSKTLSVVVLGAVRAPGRYPYLPGNDWSYYVDLAGGFINERNSFEKVVITDSDGNKMSKEDEITPETKIEAKTNDFLYYFNTYAPIIATTVGIISSTIALVTTFMNFQK